MFDPALIIAATAGLGTFAAGAVLADLAGRRSDAVSSTLDAEHETQDKNARILRAIGKTFRPVATPFDGLARSLDTTLVEAGRPHGGISGQDYVAASIMLSLLGGLALGGLQATLRIADGTEPFNALIGALRVTSFLAPCVFVFLIFGIKSQASRVAIEIEREFPFFLDLAILVVQAGGTPRQALTKFVEACPGTVLSREIAITAKDADATSFADALGRLITRIRPKSVKTILKNLAQGERSSGEVEQFYTDQAKELRYLREEMANRTAERLKANIAFPVFLMMFSVIIAALAPTIVSIRAQGLF